MTEHDEIELLAALLDGEDVPDAPASLRTLTGLAADVRDHATLAAPTPEFRASLRAELVAAADAPPGLLDRARAAWARQTANLRASTRVAVATVTASSMLGSAGVAVAAQQSLPGDALYGVKALTEDARLALAADTVAEARLHLEFARERLAELRATAGRLDSSQVTALLDEMDAHSEAGAAVLLAGVTTGQTDADEVREFTSLQRSGLVAVLADLPPQAKPEAHASLDLLRRLEASANGNGTPDVVIRDVTWRALQDDARIATPTDATTLRTENELVDVLEQFTSTTDDTATSDDGTPAEDDCDCIELSASSDEGDTAEGGTATGEDPATDEDPSLDDGTETLASAPLDAELAAPEPDADEPDADEPEGKRVESPASLQQLPVDDLATGETTVDGTTEPLLDH